jgi:hypothetical protein
MPQLAQRLGLDLPDALAGDLEVLAHFLERVVRRERSDKFRSGNTPPCSSCPGA